MYAQLLRQSFTQGGFASARGPMKQHYPVPADQLGVDMLVGKEQSAERVLKQS